MFSKLIMPLLAVLAVLAAMTLVTGDAAATVEKVLIVIDNQTTQPIATGLIPPSNDYVFLIQADGGTDLVPSGSRWFGATGMTRLNRVGQLNPDETYGCILGTFGTSLSSGWYISSGGSFNTQVSDVGDELLIGLNMSNADLAQIDGSFAITIYMMQSDDPDAAVITINNQSTAPVSTGIIANQGDEFVVASRGAMRVLTGSWPELFEGWFGPPGAIRLNRGGQISTEAYGAVLGSFNPGLANPFYIGDGGNWSTQVADEGDELLLGVNMSATDLGNSSGAFLVQVVRLSSSSAGIAGPEGNTIAARAGLGQSYPNPMNPAGTIPFEIAQDGAVLLRIYDASGRMVRTLIDSDRAAGSYSASWDGLDDHGRALASGTYFYQLSTATGSQTMKLSLMK